MRLGRMGYTYQTTLAIAYLGPLLRASLVSLEISFIAFFGGAAIGVVLAAIKHFGGGIARRLVDGYISALTNTPLLVQIYFLFFVLPDAGILLSAFTAATIGFTLNAAAYLAIIFRGGFLSVRVSEMDAAETLGMKTPQILWYVIIPHIAKVLYAPLSSFYIWLLLGTSIAGIFGTAELTGTAIDISANTGRTLEVFTDAALIYIAMTVVGSGALALIGRYVFRVKAKIF